MDAIGTAFDFLKQGLGSVLAFFYELLTPMLNDGTAYGLAIILLTIFINLVVFPLTLKQTRATRAFTAIQPQIKRIQKEYKDDPQEMQKRLMEVQKGAGATPGGCLLPLLVQMPIWFALFRLLQSPIIYLMSEETNELVRDDTGHPIIDPEATQPINPLSALGKALDQLGGFVGDPEKWIPGLNMDPFLGMNLGITPSEAMAIGIATAIPYLIMMAIMVATQYVQQWHSTYGQDRPSGQGAGTQQAITKIMPLFIGVISYNFPAGLVLYWTTSNLFRLGQQALIFRIDGRPPPPGTGKQEEPDHDDDSGNDEKKKPQQGATSKRRRRRRK